MNLRRAVPWIIRGWRIYANLAGMAVIALAVGIGIVQAVSGNDAVVTVSEVYDVSETVPVHGRYQYAYSSVRHESCPGEIVITFTTADVASPAVITVRRPAVLIEPKPYPALKVDNPLPENVTVGTWDVSTSLVSSCANREQSDAIARFRITVVPR